MNQAVGLVTRIDQLMKLFVLFGSRIILLPTDLKVDPKKAEVLVNRYAYNDMWKPDDKNMIIIPFRTSRLTTALRIMDFVFIKDKPNPIASGIVKISEKIIAASRGKRRKG